METIYLLSKYWLIKAYDGQEIFIIPSRDLVVVLGYSPKPDRVVDWNDLVRDIIAQFIAAPVWPGSARWCRTG